MRWYSRPLGPTCAWEREEEIGGRKEGAVEGEHGWNSIEVQTHDGTSTYVRCTHIQSNQQFINEY